MKKQVHTDDKTGKEDQSSHLNQEIKSSLQGLAPYQFIFTGSSRLKPEQTTGKIVIKLNDKRTKLCRVILGQAEVEIDRDSNILSPEIYDYIRNKLQDTRTAIPEEQYDEKFLSAKQQILASLIREKKLEDRGGFLASFSKFIEALPKISDRFMENRSKLEQINFDDWDIEESDENDPRCKYLEDRHKEMLDSFEEYKKQGEQYIKAREQVLSSSSTDAKGRVETQDFAAMMTDEEGNIFTVVPMPKDSNCFYSAVADQLRRLNIREEYNDGQEETGSYDTNQDLRTLALDYINANREEKFGTELAKRLQDREPNGLQGNLPENIHTIDEYVALHRKKELLADSGMIDALAHALGITLRIYRDGIPKAYNNEQEKQYTINLQHTGNYYDSLVTRLPFELLPFEASYPKESYKIKRVFEILDNLERGEKLDKQLELIGRRLVLSTQAIEKLKSYFNASRISKSKMHKVIEVDDGGYWYTDEDMNSYAKSLQKYGVNLETQFSNRLTEDLVKTLPPKESLTENEPRYICYNIGGSSDKDYSGIHWVGLVLVKHQERITILYKDPKGDFNHSSENVEKAFREHYQESTGQDNIEFIKHARAEQTDDSSCGPMTINNLEIMAKKVKEANAAGGNGIAELISAFKGESSGIEFTSQEQVSSVRVSHLLQKSSERDFNSVQDQDIDGLDIITTKLRLIKDNISGMDIDTEKGKTTAGLADKEEIANYVRMVDKSYEHIKEWDSAQIKNWSKEHKGKLSKNFSDSEKSAKEICEAIAVMDRANELATGGHRLRDTQKVATVIFMQTNQQGHISQINTGEGKTTIVCLIQALKVMQGYNGHVITSNNVLAADGVKDKQLFYQILNITAAHNNPDEKYTNGPRECYSKDVVYGSINNFQFDWLRDSFEQLKTLGDTNFDNSWVMLDEIDSLLIDQGGNIAKLSGPFPGMESLRYIYINIWVELAKAEEEVTQEILQALEKKAQEIMGRQSAEQDSPEAQAELELKNQREFEDYEDELRKSFLDKVKEKIKAKKNDLINKKLLASHLHQYTEDSVERWIEYAFSAKYQYSENVEYKMAKGQDGENIIIPVDNQNTGVSMQNTILSNGLHQFLQIKHNLCLTYESLTSCYVSNLDYIKKYGTKLSGVTGTLGSDAERGLLGSVFNLGFSVMPPFKPKQFISFSGKVSKDEDFINDVSVAALSELTRTRMKSNVEGESKAEGKQVEVGAPRAVLIVCASILEVKKIAEEIKREATAAGLSPKIRIYTDEMQAHVIEETLGINEIVIATNLAGRGTDFKTTKKLEQNGGLHVIEAFLPCNKRVEDQGFGRTARQGNAGTGQIIAKMSEVKELSIVIDTENVDFDQVLNQRDELEAARIEDIKENKITELKFKDLLFEKFSSQYARLKNEHKTGADVIKWIYVLRDLKEKWAFWLEKQAYTAETIKKFGEFSLEVVEKEYNKFLNEAKDIINGAIKHNPFYSICLAERYLEVGVDKANRNKARAELENTIRISENSELLYSAYTKLFELAIEDGGQVLERYKKAVAKIFFYPLDTGKPEYKNIAKDNLLKAQKALAIEYDYLDELINGKKIDAGNDDNRAEPILGSILVSSNQSQVHTEVSKEEQNSADTVTMMTTASQGTQAGNGKEAHDQSASKSLHNTNQKPNESETHNLFVKHLQARFISLGAYKGNIDSLIKQLNGENEFEKPKEALGSTDGIIMGTKVPRYLSKLDRENKLKKVITDRSVDELEYVGMNSVYQLKKIHDVPSTVIEGAQWQIGGAFALLASAAAFPVLLPVNGPLAGAMVSEGITDIVMALIDQGNSAFNKKDYIKGKVISYGISIATMGIGAMLSSTKLLTKATNACRSLATKLRAVEGPFAKVCQWLAGKLDKLALYLECTIEKIEFMRKTAVEQAKHLSQLKDCRKLGEFQKLQKLLKVSDVAMIHGQRVTQILTASAVGALKGVAISVCMEKIFTAGLNRLMSELKPVIKDKVKTTIKARVISAYQRGDFNRLSNQEISNAITQLFETSLGENIEQIAKEIALGVLRHCNNWKAQLATLAFESLLSGIDIARYPNKICDKFDEFVKALSKPTSSVIKNQHGTEVIDSIVNQISEPVSDILYSKIVAITGKVVVTLPKALYRGYEKHQEKKADEKAVKDIKGKLNMIDATDNEAQQANTRCVHDAVANTLGLDNSKQLADATNLVASGDGASIEDTKQLFIQNGIEVTSCDTKDAQSQFKNQGSDRGVVCLRRGDHGHALPVTMEDNCLMVTEGGQKISLDQYKQNHGYTNVEFIIPKGVNTSTLQAIQHKCNLNRIVKATHPIDYVGQDGKIKYGAYFISDSTDPNEIGKMKGYASTRFLFNAVEQSQLNAGANPAHTLCSHVGPVKKKTSFKDKDTLFKAYDEVRFKQPSSRILSTTFQNMPGDKGERKITIAEVSQFNGYDVNEQNCKFRYITIIEDKPHGRTQFLPQTVYPCSRPQQNLNTKQQGLNTKNLATLKGISPSFYEYTMKGINNILSLRTRSQKLKNVIILPEQYIFSSTQNNIIDIFSSVIGMNNIYNNRKTILALISLYNKHAVGIMFVSQETQDSQNFNIIKAFYIDPSNEPIPEGLKTIFSSNGYTLEQLPAELQRYTNCGPEVIENFMLYLAGERLSQEDAIVYNSRLVEQELLSDATKDTKNIITFDLPSLNYSKTNLEHKYTELIQESTQPIIKDRETRDNIMHQRYFVHAISNQLANEYLANEQLATKQVTTLTTKEQEATNTTITDEAIQILNLGEDTAITTTNQTTIQNSCNPLSKSGLHLYIIANQLSNEAWNLESEDNTESAEDSTIIAAEQFTKSLELYREALEIEPENRLYQQAFNIISLKIDGNNLFNEGVTLTDIAYQLQLALHSEDGKANQLKVLERQQALVGKYQDVLNAYQEAQDRFHQGFVLSQDQRFQSCIDIVQDSIELIQEHIQEIQWEVDNTSRREDVIAGTNNYLAIEPIELFKQDKQDYLLNDYLIGNSQELFYM